MEKDLKLVHRTDPSAEPSQAAGPSGSFPIPSDRMHSLQGGKVRLLPSPDAPEELRIDAERRDANRSTAKFAHTDPIVPEGAVPLHRGLFPVSWNEAAQVATGISVPSQSPRNPRVILNPTNLTPPGPPPTVTGHDGV